ncbi:NUDIX domain-containing protein [Sporosarcina sp. Marseille-Q4063]|uniref:NUDIX domain-containing protein n=1 Tax=Sporosarcina sp. Marseille-Q4063 TaxID=2810514 RepID=UPI001BB07FC3|nr:NUDIX domain-containing protein [Sporosarcina sp. Marseille-Q4063]QUW22640.1 NUDIX domain-containing protein [Sporosarcina sp. Marseille-Q4063]
MNSTKNNGFKFLEFINIKEIEIKFYQPVAGSFAIVKCEGKYLLCYNVWRQQWEFPAGHREQDETPKECAMRELYEETGQVVANLEFKGLLKVKNTMNGFIKYNPVYFAVIETLQPFMGNEETTEIMLWDLNEEIGVIDEVDLKIVDYV